MKQYNKPRGTLLPRLSGDDPLAMVALVRLPHRSLSSQSLGNY